MAQFLLVHGASHGAWCWHRVIPALEAQGHTAFAPDLPGHGADSTALEDVTLEAYVDALERALPPGPSVVVGHSMGGFPITALADRCPDRVARLVYLCAYVPRAGVSLAQMRRDWPEQPLAEAFRRNEDGLSMHFDPAMVRGKFYHDCPEAEVTRASGLLCHQALAPMQTALEPGDGWHNTAKSYVVCTDDRAIPPGYQRRMAQACAPQDRHEMAVSHSPFLAAPEALAALLSSLV